MIFEKRKSQYSKQNPVFHVGYALKILFQTIPLSSLFLFCITVNQALAIDITLAWNSNTETNLAGYKIYYDSDSGYPYNGEDADEGDSPVHISLNQDENPDSLRVEFTLHNLSGNSKYYFTVTTYDDQGFESSYSNEVSTDGLMDSNGDDAAASNTRTSSSGGGCFVTTISAF